MRLVIAFPRELRRSFVNRIVGRSAESCVTASDCQNLNDGNKVDSQPTTKLAVAREDTILFAESPEEKLKDR
jgi:hypothetical protein